MTTHPRFATLMTAPTIALLAALALAGCGSGAQQPLVDPSQAPTASPAESLAASPAAESASPSATPPAAADAGTTAALIAQLEARLSQRPDDVQAYATLGSAYLQRVREAGDPSDYARAERAFDEALKRAPDDLDATVGKGALALARHEFRDALAFGQRAQRIAPDAAIVYGVIADAQVELGMYDEVVRTVQTMVDLKPNISSYSRVSYLRELHGQVDGAIDAMKEAFDAGAPTTENREYVRVLIGNLFFNRGDVATAERAYEASLDALPGYVHAQAGLARVRASQGRWDESIELYQAAIDRIPLPEFVVALGETQEAAGRRDDAARTYELARAIQTLFRESGLNTDLELALFEADHGDPAAAVELARVAYREQPNIKASDALGWALHRAGRHEEALRFAKEALRLGTRDALFLYHAGIVARATGDDAAAREYLSRALDANRSFSPLHGPRAEQALAELAQASTP